MLLRLFCYLFLTVLMIHDMTPSEPLQATTTHMSSMWADICWENFILLIEISEKLIIQSFVNSSGKVQGITLSMTRNIGQFWPKLLVLGIINIIYIQTFALKLKTQFDVSPNFVCPLPSLSSQSIFRTCHVFPSAFFKYGL